MLYVCCLDLTMLYVCCLDLTPSAHNCSWVLSISWNDSLPFAYNLYIPYGGVCCNKLSVSIHPALGVCPNGLAILSNTMSWYHCDIPHLERNSYTCKECILIIWMYFKTVKAKVDNISCRGLLHFINNLWFSFLLLKCQEDGSKKYHKAE